MTLIDELLSAPEETAEPVETKVRQLADELYLTQERIRELQAAEDSLKKELAAQMQLSDFSEIRGSYDQRYRTQLAPERWAFEVPPEELKKLGVLNDCVKITMNKTTLDRLMKAKRLPSTIASDWQEKGWLFIEESGEIQLRKA